jgi:hypothetical protein
MTLLMRRPHSTLALAAALAFASCSAPVRESADEKTAQAPARGLAIDERCVITPVPKHAELHALFAYDRVGGDDDHVLGTFFVGNGNGSAIELEIPALSGNRVPLAPNSQYELDVRRDPSTGRAEVRLRQTLPSVEPWIPYEDVPLRGSPWAFPTERMPRSFLDKLQEPHHLMYLRLGPKPGRFLRLGVRRL